MRNRLLGGWELVNHGLRGLDGTFKRTSNYLLGRLLYEPGGGMSVLIALKDPVEQISDLIAYSGSFSTEGESVFHRVEVANRTVRIGSVEERLVRFEGEELVLSTRPDGEGSYEITWRRASVNTANG